MNHKDFNLGGVLSIKLLEASNVYWRPANINIWRELLPEAL